MSDLHIEFARFVPPTVDADVVVLAGDVGVGTKGLAWAAEAFRGMPIIYTSGNHEFYGGDWDRTPVRLRQKAHELAIHYLDVGEVVLDGVRFLGCNLWTDFCLYGKKREPEALAAAARYMTDYRTIKRDSRALLPEETQQLHFAHRAYLERKLDEDPLGRWTRTVVITHCLPSIHSVHERYLSDKSDLTSAAFASNLDYLVRKADLWVHGHTHVSCDYIMKTVKSPDPERDCRVVCNPRGYLQAGGQFENPDFNATLVIEI